MIGRQKRRIELARQMIASVSKKLRASRGTAPPCGVMNVSDALTDILVQMTAGAKRSKIHNNDVDIAFTPILRSKDAATACSTNRKNVRESRAVVCLSGMEKQELELEEWALKVEQAAVDETLVSVHCLYGFDEALTYNMFGCPLG